MVLILKQSFWVGSGVETKKEIEEGNVGGNREIEGARKKRREREEGYVKEEEIGYRYDWSWKDERIWKNR